MAARDMEELLKQGDALAGLPGCPGSLVSTAGIPVGRKSAGPSSAPASGWFLVGGAFFVALWSDFHFVEPWSTQEAWWQGEVRSSQSIHPSLGCRMLADLPGLEQ